MGLHTICAIMMLAFMLAVGACSDVADLTEVATTTPTAIEPTLPPSTVPPSVEIPADDPPPVTTSAVPIEPAPQEPEEQLPPILVAAAGSRSFAEWSAIAAALAPSILPPSDCGTPLDEPESLPNSERSYRGGVHLGIDFICEEYGHDAIAALPGRVVMANNSFVDPTPEERAIVLQTARDLGYTPPWTLAMLYGRFVVIDHGIVDGAGHVVTLYAHLDRVDETIRPGLLVEVGARIGEIGNIGTATAASDGDRPRSIHLHWDIYVGTGFLGQGLSASETSDVYRTLFTQDG